MPPGGVDPSGGAQLLPHTSPASGSGKQHRPSLELGSIGVAGEFGNILTAFGSHGLQHQLCSLPTIPVQHGLTVLAPHLLLL